MQRRAAELASEVSRAKLMWRNAGESGPLLLSREAWQSIHTDFRNTDSTQPRCLVLANCGTCSIPVKFTD